MRAACVLRVCVPLTQTVRHSVWAYVCTWVCMCVPCTYVLGLWVAVDTNGTKLVIFTLTLTYPHALMLIAHTHANNTTQQS